MSAGPVEGDGFVEIHYHRSPADTRLYQQRLVVSRPDLKVTFAERFEAEGPIEVAGRSVLEPGAPVVWFVIPGRWYDLGLFHLRDGTFTGYYTNMIAPPRIQGARWQLRDLYLDLWMSVDGSMEVLDRDEFEAAVARGWVDAATARRVVEELDSIVAKAKLGRWPPDEIRRFDLERVRALLSAEPPEST